MSTTSLRCRSGHQWDVPIADPSAPTAPVAPCPFCGQPPEQESTVYEQDQTGPYAGSKHVPSPHIAGYEVLGLLGEGGMGVVYRARQLALHRIVALKTLRTADAGWEEQQRFRTEAEAVARLRHPGIVQIYEVNKEDERLYFSMELVEGGSLDTRLRQGPLPAELAARVVEHLAEAMHAAHEQHIVHRDLKPSNVLLGSSCPEDRTYWEPKIGDFGLARKLDEPGWSITGQVLGTPSYMAPEQAQGLVRQVGPAVDIYALGAILYECLTGRPPFRGPTLTDTLLLVLHAEPVPVRRLQPRTPRDLETICLKCLRKEPAKRYASARELADDLARFRDGRPIHARPMGAPERAYRWCRQHPALTLLSTAVVLLLVAVTVISLVGYFQVRAANEQLAQANADLVATAAEKERKSAEALRNFDLAEQSMEQTVFHIAHDPLLKDRGFFSLRRQLLAPAVRLYGKLTAARSDDPRLEAKRGQALGLLAEVQSMLGETEQAAASYRAMRDLFAALMAAYPDDRGHRLQLTIANRQLAVVLMQLARHDEALAALARAGAMARDLVAFYPEIEDHHHELIAYHVARGADAYGREHFQEARQEWVEALALQEAKERRFPVTRVARDTRAAIHKDLSMVHLQLGQKAEARIHGEACLKLRQQLVEEVPTSPDYRSSLVSSWGNLGVIYRRLELSGETERALRTALREARLLVTQAPTLPLARRVLAQACHNLAFWLVNEERLAEAEPLHAEATALLEELVRAFPTVPDNGLLLGEHCITRGSHFLLVDAEGSLALADRAIAVLTVAGEADPRNPEIHRWLGRGYVLRMSSLAGLHRFDEAVRTGERALRLDPSWQQMSDLTSNLFFARLLARQQLLPALRQADAGKHVAAARTANRFVERPLLGSLRVFAATSLPDALPALATANELAGREAAVGDTLFNAACAFARCARAAKKDAPALVQSYEDRAMQLLTRARDEGYFEAPEQRKLLDNDSDLAELRRRPDFKILRSASPAAAATRSLPRR